MACLSQSFSPLRLCILSAFCWVFVACSKDSEESTDTKKEAPKSKTPAGYSLKPSSYSSFCVVKFPKPTEIRSSFDKPEFTTSDKDLYLLKEFSLLGEYKAKLLWIHEAGPYEFEAKTDSFTTDCTSETSRDVWFAFSDLTLYSDASASKKTCTLTQGKTADFSSGGWSLESSKDQQAIYSFDLGTAYENECPRSSDQPLFAKTPWGVYPWTSSPVFFLNHLRARKP